MDTAPLPRPRRRVRRAIVATSLAVVLAGGSATAWALDRFVVDHVEISDVDAYVATQSASTIDVDPAGTSSSTSAGVLTDTTYTSDDAVVTLSTVTTGSGDGTVTYYVADLALSDATVLQTAFAENSFGTNITETTSAIAGANDAVFAVNGDYYGFRDTGIVIRNGVAFRDEGVRDGLAFYRDGHVEVYDETSTTADALVEAGVWNTLSFGPALLADGQVVAGIEDLEIDTNIGNHSIQGEQPRTAIGVIDDNHLVVVVVDGRSPGYSAGVTMTGLAEILQGLGAQTAYNLDGGGSSTMVFGGELVNDPLGNGTERGTSDILYIGGLSAATEA